MKYKKLLLYAVRITLRPSSLVKKGERSSSINTEQGANKSSDLKICFT